MLQPETKDSELDPEVIHRQLFTADGTFDLNVIDTLMGLCRLLVHERRRHKNTTHAYAEKVRRSDVLEDRLKELNVDIINSRVRIRELEEQVHECPKCGEACKECQCVAAKLAKLAELEGKDNCSGCGRPDCDGECK